MFWVFLIFISGDWPKRAKSGAMYCVLLSVSVYANLFDRAFFT